jgi:hypothetical protein
MNLLSKYKTISPVAWCERNITLDYGAFNAANHPLLVEPLQSLANSRGKTVGLIGSVQHIKTLLAQLWQLYGLQIEPSRAAMYDLTESALKEFSDDKFTPLIDSTDAILQLIPDQAYRRTKFFTSTNYGAIRLLSANVLAARNSKTLERITCDESWAYGENWLDQIKDRMSSYSWSWQMFLPTSGQTKGSELDEMWERSTKRTWHIKCDCCDEYIPYIWRQEATGDEIPIGGMRWAAKEEYTSDNGQIDFSALAASVYYECQLCGGKLDANIAKQKKRNLSGKYIPLNPAGDESLDFYHYNAMAHIPWAKLVEQFKLAQLDRERGSLDALENFIRKRLAESWTESDHVSADVQVSAKGGYALNEPWNVANQFTFCTVDVQKDHYYYVIRSWAIVDGTLRSRLLDCRKVVTTAEIRESCDRWKIPQNALGTGGACRVFLDGNYNTNQVQRIALENGWMVFRGDSAKDYMNQDGFRRIYSDLKPVDAYDGTAQSRAGRVGQFFFSKQSAKNRLSLLRSLKDHRGNLVWTHADDAGEMYERQINAWAKIAKTKPDGSVYYDWINRDKHNDHYYDCEAMQAVCAAMCKTLGTETIQVNNDA